MLFSTNNNQDLIIGYLEIELIYIDYGNSFSIYLFYIDFISKEEDFIFWKMIETPELTGSDSYKMQVKKVNLCLSTD